MPTDEDRAALASTCGVSHEPVQVVPGATVTVGNKSRIVFLMIWKPKDFSSEELTGRGSKP